MSKKKNKSKQGTYALCITAGLIVGLGLGPAFGSVLIATTVGAILGAGAAFMLTR